jgi:hypothetical protein
MNKKTAYLILTVAFSVFIFCTNENSALVRNNQYDAGGIAGDSSITVTAMKDTVVAINDSFFIHATGTNVNGTVKRYFWALDGKNYDSITDGGRIKTAFATSGVKLVLVKASNDTGVASLRADTVNITVHSYAPVVVAMPDTTIAINDTILIQAAGSDTNGTIKKYYWALDSMKYRDSTVGGYIKTAYKTAGIKDVLVKVRDDDGIFSKTDTVKITVYTYMIDPTTVSIGDSGGSGYVYVTAIDDSAWTATTNVSWISITSGSSGIGSGTVIYSVQANTSSLQRTGIIKIAGKNFTIIQYGVTVLDGAFDGTWTGVYSGTYTYLSGSTWEYSNETLSLTIKDTIITASQPIVAEGTIDGYGNGSWQPDTAGIMTPFKFKGTFTSGGTASGTWTLTISGTGAQAGTGNGTWTAVRQ